MSKGMIFASIPSLPYPEGSPKPGCYSFTFLDVDTLLADNGHAGPDAGHDRPFCEIEHCLVGTFENGSAQPVVLFFRFGIEAHGQGGKTRGFQFRDHVPARPDKRCMAVGIEPDRDSSLVQPLRQADDRIEPAGGFAKTGENDFFVCGEIEIFQFLPDLFFRRIPGKAEVVSVNSVAAFPDAKDAIGAAPVCDVEV